MSKLITYFNNPEDEKDVFECTECGKEMSKNNGVCSSECHKSSMR